MKPEVKPEVTKIIIVSMITSLKVTRFRDQYY